MKILVPLDCRSDEQPVMQFCTSMRGVRDSIIILTHVAPLPGFVDRVGVERVERYLADIAGPLRAAGAHVMQMLRRGDPATEIVALARILDADLIVMLARRKQRHGDRRLGGVIEAVVLHAEQPVVTINDVVSAGTAPPESGERAAA